MDMPPPGARLPLPARGRPEWVSEFMKILVTFAVRSEFAPWRRRRSFLRLPGDSPVFETTFGGARVRAVLTGMGEEHALESAKRALAYKPDICISTGLAGALRSGYQPGDIVAARLVSEAGEPVAVASHRELLSTAVDCGARQIERMATSRTLVARAEEKRQLGSQAEAADMESYTILVEAARCGVPAVAVRAISDTVDFDVPYHFERALDAQGQVRTLGVVSQVLRKPAGLPALLKLARDCGFASRRLADFLDAFAGAMAGRLSPLEQDSVAAL
jgi:adenosylhomocysteine nucleosidase